jgi:hypothetical protein
MNQIIDNCMEIDPDLSKPPQQKVIQQDSRNVQSYNSRFQPQKSLSARFQQHRAMQNQQRQAQNMQNTGIQKPARPMIANQVKTQPSQRVPSMQAHQADNDVEIVEPRKIIDIDLTKDQPMSTEQKSRPFEFKFVNDQKRQHDATMTNQRATNLINQQHQEQLSRSEPTISSEMKQTNYVQTQLPRRPEIAQKSQVEPPQINQHHQTQVKSSTQMHSVRDTSSFNTTEQRFAQAQAVAKSIPVNQAQPITQSRVQKTTAENQTEAQTSAQLTQNQLYQQRFEQRFDPIKQSPSISTQSKIQQHEIEKKVTDKIQLLAQPSKQEENKYKEAAQSKTPETTRSSLLLNQQQNAQTFQQQKPIIQQLNLQQVPSHQNITQQRIPVQEKPTQPTSFTQPKPEQLNAPVQQKPVTLESSIQHKPIQINTSMQQKPTKLTPPIQQRQVQSSAPVQQKSTQGTVPAQPKSMQVISQVQQTPAPVQQKDVQMTPQVQQTSVQQTKPMQMTPQMQQTQVQQTVSAQQPKPVQTTSQVKQGLTQQTVSVQQTKPMQMTPQMQQIQVQQTVSAQQSKPVQTTSQVKQGLTQQTVSVQQTKPMQMTPQVQQTLTPVQQQKPQQIPSQVQQTPVPVQQKDVQMTPQVQQTSVQHAAPVQQTKPMQMTPQVQQTPVQQTVSAQQPKPVQTTSQVKQGLTQQVVPVQQTKPIQMAPQVQKTPAQQTSPVQQQRPQQIPSQVNQTQAQQTAPVQTPKPLQTTQQVQQTPVQHPTPVQQKPIEIPTQPKPAEVPVPVHQKPAEVPTPVNQKPAETTIPTQVQPEEQKTPLQQPPKPSPNQDVEMLDDTPIFTPQPPADFLTTIKNFDCYFRSKAMNIYKVSKNGSSSKVYTLSDLFLPKTVYTSDQVVYVIGGAKDLKVKNTVNIVLEIDFKHSEVRAAERTRMSSSRASFGCTIGKDGNTIYVAGGYVTENTVFDKCEMYKRDENRWYELPGMGKPKCSNGLCEFESKGKMWLYSFGGLWRSPNSSNVSLLNDIERLDLGDTFENGWETLSIRLLENICDVGVYQVSEKSIMVYGGWNIKARNDVFYFEPDSERKVIKTAATDNEKLVKPDFFLINGTVGRNEDNKIFIQGHHFLHKYNPVTKQFAILESS